jgi:hypothetical protein
VNARDPKSHQNAMTGLLEAESHLLWSLHVAAYMNEVNRRANLLERQFLHPIRKSYFCG